jgi:hypothetical protein
MSTKSNIYNSMNDVINHNPMWFSRENTRFFGTRVCESTFTAFPDGSAAFVTSEKSPAGARRYSVRHAYWDAREDGWFFGQIETVAGDFHSHGSRVSAVKALKAFSAKFFPKVA